MATRAEGEQAILVIGEDGSVGLYRPKERSGMAVSGYEQHPWVAREGRLEGDPERSAQPALSWAKDQHFAPTVSKSFSSSANGDFWVDVYAFA